MGEPGQHATQWCGSMDEAEKYFKKKFTDKTKNKWDNRHNFVPAPGKYTLLEMDDDDEGEEVCVRVCVCVGGGGGGGSVYTVGDG